jgi:hypothetical protein
MKTKLTKKLLTFILLLGGMFSFILAHAQLTQCSSNKQLMYKCLSTISCATKCVPLIHVQSYLNKGWGIGPCPEYCILFRFSQVTSPEITSDLMIYPNPVSSSATISFSLSQSQNVSIRVFDISGRLVATISNEFYEAGSQEIVWNTNAVTAGMYFLQFQSNEYQEKLKLVVTK